MVSTPERNHVFRAMSHKSYCTLRVWSLHTRMVAISNPKRNVIKLTPWKGASSATCRYIAKLEDLTLNEKQECKAREVTIVLAVNC